MGYMSAHPALLQIRSVSKHFGSLHVTNDLSLDVFAGEALGILGPNGAGKTTLFNLITGDLFPNLGQIVFKDQDITRSSAHIRCQLGIGRSYQIALPFEGMTVFENLLVGAKFGAQDKSDQVAHERCVQILDRTGLLRIANRLAGSLTLLDRKRLELARALATNPELILLDEIAGGLTEHEALELVEVVNQIKKDGVTIIWIEHVVHALMAVATRLVVINFGEILAQGDPKAVMESPDVKRVYLGLEI
jgi:branched-chain amino acid transport system ATP-binding protein